MCLHQEYGIKGFPTIKVFVPGKPPVDYQGARDAKPIAEFALKQVSILKVKVWHLVLKVISSLSPYDEIGVMESKKL